MGISNECMKGGPGRRSQPRVLSLPTRTLRKYVAEMTDKELEEEVRNSPLVKMESDLMIKRLDAGFIFVNFNLET